jgi:hypothetical protein
MNETTKKVARISGSAIKCRSRNLHSTEKARIVMNRQVQILSPRLKIDHVSSSKTNLQFATFDDICVNGIIIFLYCVNYSCFSARRMNLQRNGENDVP